ncbi:hypothetical protein FACS189413_19010 [Bacteroidia bacterium]|nr:hypothetical protein FACS189413_19010 [Bacteroidia bacterium]
MLIVKEDAKYLGKFLVNENILNPSGAWEKLVKYEKNPDTADKYVREFFKHGGDTGYSHLFELRDMQREIDKAINPKLTLDKAWDAFKWPFETINKIIENTTRLAVYQTSREMGRSIERSISDAKEITLNFNRKGAGGGFSDYVMSAYLFVNAGVQALANFLGIFMKHPVKMTGLIGGYVSMGMITPLINAMLMGGDDDEYWNLPDYERQNNICLRIGDGFMKIPLPQELRVFNKIGDEIAQVIAGRKDFGDAFGSSLLGLLDLIPTDPMGAAETGTISSVLPDAFKLWFQLAENKNFTGSPIGKEKAWKNKALPEWRRENIRINREGEPITPGPVIFLTRMANYVTGGDNYEKGVINVNPDDVNHILRGYLGGFYQLATQPINSFVKRFYTSIKDMEEKNTGGDWRRMYDTLDKAKERTGQYRARIKDLKLEQYDMNLEKFVQDTIKLNKAYEQARIIERFGEVMEEKNKLLKDYGATEKISETDKERLREVNKALRDSILFYKSKLEEEMKNSVK